MCKYIPPPPPYTFSDCICTMSFQIILSIILCLGSPNTKSTSVSRFLFFLDDSIGYELKHSMEGLTF